MGETTMNKKGAKQNISRNFHRSQEGSVNIKHPWNKRSYIQYVLRDASNARWNHWQVWSASKRKPTWMPTGSLPKFLLFHMGNWVVRNHKPHRYGLNYDLHKCFKMCQNISQLTSLKCIKKKTNMNANGLTFLKFLLFHVGNWVVRNHKPHRYGLNHDLHKCFKMCQNISVCVSVSTSL